VCRWIPTCGEADSSDGRPATAKREELVVPDPQAAKLTLMNFNATTLKAGLKRLDHPDRYVKKIS
jgi:hypothetical protein